MTSRITTCTRCGAPLGVGSIRRRGRCLDCQTELAARKGMRTAVYHVVILTSGVYVALTGVDGPLSFLVLWFALFDVLAMAMTVIHEASHSITALLVGFGVREISLGVGPRVAKARLGKVNLVLHLYPVGGHTATVPGGRSIRAKMTAVILAGPLSHLPLAGWLATLETRNEMWDTLLGPAPELILFYLAVNIVPVFENDGRNLFRLMRMSDERIEAIGTFGAVLCEMAPTVDDSEANPAHRGQRDSILSHLQNPALEPAERAISLNNLAALDLLMDDPELLDEADNASAEAYELMPDLSAIRNTRGSALIHLGRFSEGVELMEPTLGKIPVEFLGESHLELAFAYANEGEVFHARGHLAACRGRTGRRRLYDETLALTGSLEVRVLRAFISESATTEQAAERFKGEAGPLALITGQALRAHIAATGRDRDLLPMAGILAPESGS